MIKFRSPIGDILYQESALLDVAVIGAGPTGSRAAYGLALKGHKVAVLEKGPSAGLKTCCTGIISEECVSKFNIPHELVYRKITTSRLFSPSGYSIQLVRPDAQAYVVNRSALDKHLSESAQNQGVVYSFNTSVEKIDYKSDSVVLYIRSENRTSTLEARAAVLACGFNTPLVRRSGFGLSHYFTTGAQVEVQANGLEETEIYFGRQIAPKFFAWLVPTQNGCALAGLMTSHSAGAYLRTWLSDLTAQNRIATVTDKISYHGIPLYPLQSTYKDRLLVIGDAAGQVKPTTGGGLYFGLLCADIAAETLHKGLFCNNLSSRFLSAYQKQWRNILAKELHSEYLARRFYQLLTDNQVDKIFKFTESRGLANTILSDNRISFDRHGQALNSVIRKGISHLLFKK